MFGDSNLINITLDKNDNKELDSLNKAYLASNTLNKSMYDPRLRYFNTGKGEDSEVQLEEMLAYWLSWYVLPSCPKNGSDAYVFPLAIQLAKGESLALVPLYLCSLFFELDECIQNIVLSVGCYHVVTHADTPILKIFIWERFRTISPRPIEFKAVEMVKVEIDVEIIKKPDHLYEP